CVWNFWIYWHDYFCVKCCCQHIYIFEMIWQRILEPCTTMNVYHYFLLMIFSIIHNIIGYIVQFFSINGIVKIIIRACILALRLCFYRRKRLLCVYFLFKWLFHLCRSNHYFIQKALITTFSISLANKYEAITLTLAKVNIFFSILYYLQ